MSGLVSVCLSECVFVHGEHYVPSVQSSLAQSDGVHQFETHLVTTQHLLRMAMNKCKLIKIPNPKWT